MSKLKDQMTSEIAGIILQHVRNHKGRLSEVSDDCRINRREFNVRGISKMKFHRLLRIFYDLLLILTYAEFTKMMEEIINTLKDYADEHDYTVLDE